MNTVSDSETTVAGHAAPPAEARSPEGEASGPRGLLTLHALIVFVALDLGFRLFGFDRVYRRLLRRPAGPERWAPADARRQGRATFVAVQRATMLYYRRRKDCLPKALTTLYLLRRQGIPTELCFGVKKFPFSAHSWIEVCGERLDDHPPRVQSYTVIHRVTG